MKIKGFPESLRHAIRVSYILRMKMFAKLERGREEQAELQATVLPVFFPRSLSKSLSPGDDV